MIKDIIRGVAANIAYEFENIKIYGEEVQQGFETPCFSVFCSSIKNELYRGSRYRTENNIEVHYYWDNDNKREESNDIMNTLYKCLEYITITGGLLRGENMSMEIKENYYCFKVSYCCFYFTEENYEKMGELKVERTLK